MSSKKHELTNIELFEEDGQYYLKLNYIIEDDYKIEEVIIPKVRLPFNKNVFPEITYSREDRDPIMYGIREESYIKTGCNNTLELRKCKIPETYNDIFYLVKIIDEKHKEMTVAEIEKALGYKVKIIAEKGKTKA